MLYLLLWSQPEIFSLRFSLAHEGLYWVAILKLVFEYHGANE